MRRFRLINSKGESYDITTEDAFFHDPEGLGFQRDDTYHRVGSRYILANTAPSQGEIKGKLNFISSDPYGDYRAFLNFCNDDLQLEYEAGLTRSKYAVKSELSINYSLALDGSYIGYYDFSKGIFTALYRKVFYEDYAELPWTKLVDDYTYELADYSEYTETSPVNEGWYVDDGEGGYVLTEDTRINPEHIYYELFPVLYEAIYTEDMTEEERQETSPIAEGWYEYSYVELDYVLSEDNEVLEGKQYYEQILNEYSELYWPNMSPQYFGYYEFDEETGYSLTNDTIFELDKDYYEIVAPKYVSNACAIYECEIIGEDEPQIQNGSLILCNGLNSLTFDAETAIEKQVNGVCKATGSNKIQICLVNAAFPGMVFSDWIDDNQPQFVYKLDTPLIIPYADGKYDVNMQYDMTLSSETAYSNGTTSDDAELSATYRKLDGTTEHVSGNHITLEDCVIDSNIQELKITPEYDFDSYVKEQAWFPGAGNNLVPMENRSISGVYEASNVDVVIPETEVMSLAAGQAYQYAIQYEVENASSDGFYDEGPHIDIKLMASGQWTEKIDAPICISDTSVYDELKTSFYPVDWADRNQSPENPKSFYGLESLDIVDVGSYSFFDFPEERAITETSFGSNLIASYIPSGFQYVLVDQIAETHPLVHISWYDEYSPVEEGWYVKVNGTYQLSTDSSIQPGVSYYSYLDPQYISPSAEGWYVRINGEYIRSTDTEMSSSISYYDYHFVKTHVRLTGYLSREAASQFSTLDGAFWAYLKNTLNLKNSDKYAVAYEVEGSIHGGSIDAIFSKDINGGESSYFWAWTIPEGDYEFSYDEMSDSTRLPIFYSNVKLEADSFVTFGVKVNSMSTSQMTMDLTIYPTVTFENDYIYALESGLAYAQTVATTEHIINWSEDLGVLYGANFDLRTGSIEKTWECLDSYDGEELPGRWLSSMDPYDPNSTPTIGAQVLYELDSPIIYEEVFEPLYDFSEDLLVGDQTRSRYIYARSIPTSPPIDSDTNPQINNLWNIYTGNMIGQYENVSDVVVASHTILDLETDGEVWFGSGYKDGSFTVDHDMTLFISSTEDGIPEDHDGAVVRFNIAIILDKDDYSDDEEDGMDDAEEDGMEEFSKPLLYLDESYGNVKSIAYPLVSTIYYDAFDYQKYYRDVRISKIDKTELDKYGTLEIDITFKCLSPWMAPFRVFLQNAIDPSDPFTWPEHHSGSAEKSETWNITWGATSKMGLSMTSDSNVLSPCIIRVNGPLTNPRWSLYVNDILVSDGLCRVSIPEDQYLIISSYEDEFSIGIYGADGSFINDVYNQCDFSKELFVFLRNGENLIQISDDGGNYTYVVLEGSIYYESV